MGISKQNSIIQTQGKGTYEITGLITDALNDSGFSDGLINGANAVKLNASSATSSHTASRRPKFASQSSSVVTSTGEV